MRRLREKHGVLRDDAAESGAYARPPEQLGLFGEAEGPAPAGDLRLSPAVLPALAVLAVVLLAADVAARAIEVALQVAALAARQPESPLAR